MPDQWFLYIMRIISVSAILLTGINMDQALSHPSHLPLTGGQAYTIVWFLSVLICSVCSNIWDNPKEVKDQ